MADKRAFFKVDVGYLMNPKVAAVAAQSPTAVLLHLAATAYAAQHLTDGVAPLALIMRIVGATQDDAELLFKKSLLIDRHDGDVEVHDYLEHQRSAAEAKDAETKAQRAAHARWNRGAHATSDASSIASSTAGSTASGMPREKREKRDKEGTLTSLTQPTTAATTPAPRTRGTRLPEPFEITDAMTAWAAREAPGLNLARATEEFCDYWRGVAGAKGVKLDWVGTWRNDMRRKAERAGTLPASARTARQIDPLNPWRG